MSSFRHTVGADYSTHLHINVQGQKDNDCGFTVELMLPQVWILWSLLLKNADPPLITIDDP